ncbi:MAG: hypothetical protein E3J72_11790 [Planctomycetota bacterium]|nr:MAG: hypothetical protein E3J72_11790 [Planctomycetota bacterium]
MRPAVKCILLLLVICAVGVIARADELHLENGGIVVGKIIKETRDKVTIKTPFGDQEFYREEIIKIVRKKTPQDEYEEKKKSLKETADAHYRLGKWCSGNKLTAKATLHYKKAIGLDPDHEKARKALGHVKHDGKWMTEYEANRAKGLVKYKGEWVKKEELEKLKAAARKKVEKTKIKKTAKKKGSRYKKYPPKSPGLINQATVTIEGSPESYAAFVPKGYSHKKPHPTVILAHGQGDKALNFLRAIQGRCGRQDLLLLSLEKCDHSGGRGMIPKYTAELKKEFNIDEDRLYLFGFSAGGFRAWSDVLSYEKHQKEFDAICFCGCARGGDGPPKLPKYTRESPRVCLLGDLKDPNYRKYKEPALRMLEAGGYPDPKIIEHNQGHTVPKETAQVFKWFTK